MKHPLLMTLFATMLTAMLAVGLGSRGMFVDLLRFLAVFFALCLFLLVAFVHFWNRPWPLDTHHGWVDGPPRRRRSWRRSTGLVKW
ncbi:MAG TPA: hypothetical protein VHW65_03565 [Gemmatimonadales bacterium]|jgi:hypothetical protein|nr:hypothetical protein [Gemmatimonadales bacterium]